MLPRLLLRLADAGTHAFAARVFRQRNNARRPHAALEDIDSRRHQQPHAPRRGASPVRPGRDVKHLCPVARLRLVELTRSTDIQLLPVRERRHAAGVETNARRRRVKQLLRGNPDPRLHLVSQVHDGAVMVQVLVMADGFQRRTNARLKLVDVIGEPGCGEDIRQDRRRAFAVEFPAFGGFENRTRHQAFHLLCSRDHGSVHVPKHLVHAVREEGEPAGIRIVIDPVIVLLHHVTVPMPCEHLQRGEVQEPLEVEQRAHSLQTQRFVGFRRGRDERFQVRPPAHVAIAGSSFERRIDVLEESAVVEVALRVLEMTFEERLVEALLQHIKPEVATVQRHSCVRGPRRRDSRREEQVRADRLRHIGGILHRVVEGKFVETAELLFIDELVKVQRERRLLIVDVAKASRRAFQMNAHLFVHPVALVDGGADIFPRVLTEPGEIRLGDLNVDVRDDSAREETLRFKRARAR